MNKLKAKAVTDLLENLAGIPELMEVARKAIEDELIFRRDSGIFTIRNNGLVIKSFEGEFSHIIRMGSEDAMSIGLKAIAKYINEME